MATGIFQDLSEDPNPLPINTKHAQEALDTLVVMKQAAEALQTTARAAQAKYEVYSTEELVSCLDAAIDELEGEIALGGKVVDAAVRRREENGVMPRPRALKIGNVLPGPTIARLSSRQSAAE